MTFVSTRRVAALASACAATAGAVVMATPAHAAQSTQMITCGDTNYTIRTNNNNSSDMGGWGAAQVVGASGHGVPTSFSGVAVDSNTQAVLGQFSSVKGLGNANHNQATTTCTQTYSGSASDLFGPNLPPGVTPDEPVTMTITIQVVIKQ